MAKIETFSDERLVAGCALCGEQRELTKDHNPARVFLDEPYPPDEELPKVFACEECNGGASEDETYVACLIECARCGTADPARVVREKVRAALLHSPLLAARIGQARREANGRTLFTIELSRVRRVFEKIARAHAVWECSDQRLGEPEGFQIFVLHELATEERQRFEEIPQSGLWPEIGTRAFIRTVVAGPQAFSLADDWVDVQEARYRYIVAQARSGTLVRMAFSEYIGVEVRWDDPR